MALTTDATDLAGLRSLFADTAGYLSACTAGPLPTTSQRALVEEVGRLPDMHRHIAATERCRDLFAALVQTTPDRVAVAAQVAVFASMIAANLPDDAEVLCPEHEFSSLVLPFVHAGRHLRVRTAPAAELAEHIGPDTHLVAFSIVQSATGEVLDAAAIRAAAATHDAITFCDATQAAGWVPLRAGEFDLLACHAYKWLCSPRGAAFLTVSDRAAESLRPVQANWCAGEDPWASCYGPDAILASSARRYDLAPAALSFVAAEPSLRAFAESDITAIHDYATALAQGFRKRLGLPTPVRPSAIVTWADPDGTDLARLQEAGIVASGRNGRARVAFHVFNTHNDLARSAAALGR